jgi:hypothetical protein
MVKIFLLRQNIFLMIKQIYLTMTLLIAIVVILELSANGFYFLLKLDKLLNACKKIPNK